jgi:hypothetical protein
MAAKKASSLPTILSVVFTSVVGPLLVHLVTTAPKAPDAPPVETGASDTFMGQGYFAPEPDPEERVIAQESDRHPRQRGMTR